RAGCPPPCRARSRWRPPIAEEMPPASRPYQSRGEYTGILRVQKKKVLSLQKSPPKPCKTAISQVSTSPRPSHRLASGLMNLAASSPRASNLHARKPAVFWGEQEHSYEQLLARSFQLANHL